MGLGSSASRALVCKEVTVSFARSLTICSTGLATIANMGAEVGATTSAFPYTPNMRSYLHATHRGPVALAADKAAETGFLCADKDAEYDEVIEIVCPPHFVKIHSHFIFCCRTYLKSSRPLMALLLLILQHLFPSLAVS